MKISPFISIYPDLSIIASTDAFFETVKEKYPEYNREGFFLDCNDPSLFVYKIVSPTGNYLGIITATDINELLEEHILKHEKTLATKEQYMMELMLERHAQIKPVLLGYPEVPEFNRLKEKIIKGDPFLRIHFKESDEYHTLWKVVNPEIITEIKDIFRKNIPKAYIADGHHRSTTCAIIRKNKLVQGEDVLDHLLTIYFPFSDLKIYDYNKVIDLGASVTPVRLMAELSLYFKVKATKSSFDRNKKHQLMMYLDMAWYKLEWKKSVFKKYGDNKDVLDSYLFNEIVLNKILGIIELRTDNRVQSISGTLGKKGVKNEVVQLRNAVGFMIPAIKVEELIDTADAKDFLPPKSTWFEPRIKNGVIGLKF